MALAQEVSGGAIAHGYGELGDFGPGNCEIVLAPPVDEPSLLTLTVELRGSQPRIWRRLSLPGDLTLHVVHTLFQAAMGWTDSHLHRFQPGIGLGYAQWYFVTEFDEEEGAEGTHEEGGVDLSWSGGVLEPHRAVLEKLREQIVSGEILVPAQP